MRVYTFYSYKGGLGRSLLLANMAHTLCECSKRVFAIDLDFEAPGLRYKFPTDAARRSKKGALDFIVSVQNGRTNDGRLSDPGPLSDYVETFEYQPRLFLMPAGSVMPADYVRQLVNLDGKRLFESPDSPGFDAFALLLHKIRTEYEPDFLLVDARTGITQLGTFAVKLLADAAVCLFSCSDESYQGALLQMTAIAHANRRNEDEPQTAIYPVIARVPPTVDGRKLAQAFTKKIEQAMPELGGRRIPVLHSDLSFEIDDRSGPDDPRSVAESALLADYLDVANILFESEQEIVDTLAPLLQAGDQAEPQPAPMPVRERIRRRSQANGHDGYNAGRHLLRVVDKRYIERSTLQPPAAQRAYMRWIETMIPRLVREVHAGPLETDAALTVNAEREVAWDVIPEMIRSGDLDFCADPYYMSKGRQLLLGHFPFGAVRRLWLVASRGADVDNLLRHGTSAGDDGQSNEPQTLAQVFDELRGVLRDAGSNLASLHVVAMEDTSASNECQSALTSIGYADATVVLVKDLADFHRNLEAFPSFALGVADIGLFPADSVAPSSPWRAVTVRYEHGPIPVGFIYPREDVEWGRTIAKVVGELILEGGLDESAWSRIEGELRDVGIEPCTFAQIRQNVMRGKSMRDAILWWRDYAARWSARQAKGT